MREYKNFWDRNAGRYDCFMQKDRLSVFYSKHAIILAYFQMLYEETRNTLSEHADRTEKTQQDSEKTKPE